jgi:hypothetical protein
MLAMSISCKKFKKRLKKDVSPITIKIYGALKINKKTGGIKMRHFVGIDLHWNNTCTLISDDQDRCVLKKKFPNQLAVILEFLEPYKDTIVGIVVESTPNWYWLVDGLMEAGYSVHLAHPAGIESYSGKKHTNDFDDAAHLAYLLRIGKLPKGYIYPKAVLLQYLIVGVLQSFRYR